MLELKLLVFIIVQMEIPDLKIYIRQRSVQVWKCYQEREFAFFPQSLSAHQFRKITGQILRGWNEEQWGCSHWSSIGLLQLKDLNQVVHRVLQGWIIFFPPCLEVLVTSFLKLHLSLWASKQVTPPWKEMSKIKEKKQEVILSSLNISISDKSEGFYIQIYKNTQHHG